MFEKLKVEKVELVKRVIRQNNYAQYDKTYQQCLELGLNINRPALDRFANKLELIDKAQLSKRHYELSRLEQVAREEKQNSSIQQFASSGYQQNVHQAKYQDAAPSHSQRPRIESPKPVTRNLKSRPVKREMSYEQVKQRETEITFELGEMKIRENELLQELIRLTEMLDNSQKN